MRTIFTTSISILLGLQSVAQPIIPAGAALPISGYSHQWTVAQTFIDVPVTGANATWDLSNLDENYTGNMVWGPVTLNPSFYPEATLQRGFPGNTMWAVDNDSVNYYGRQQLLSIESYTDPKLVLRLPLTFGDAWYDVYEGSATGYSSVTGRYHAAVTGYGTLELPSGEYTDVLRVDILDTTYRQLAGSPEGPSISVDNIARFYKESYAWCLLEVLVQRQLTGNMQTSSTVYYMAPDVNVGLVPGNADDLQVELIPNPTNDRLVVRGPDVDRVTSVAVFDMAGRNVSLNGILENGVRQFTLNVTALAPGMYNMHATTSDGSILRRSFMVE